MTADRGARSDRELVAGIHHLLSNDSSHLATPTETPPERLLPFPQHAWSQTPRIPLPLLPDPPATLTDALRQRRSHRTFAAFPLRLSRLGALLRLSYGGSGRSIHAYGYRRYPLNIAPSSGGLQAVNIYVAARNVTELPAAVYYFHPHFNDLRRVHDRDLEPLLDRAVIQPELRAAPVVLILTCSLDRTLWKYGARHYRTIHIDTGVVAQNLHLVATALGLATCLAVGFYDRETADLVDVSVTDEVVTLVVAVGEPSRTATSVSGQTGS
ncbi:MAG: SagB/ThcOx family dehydrogenase [Pseudonocardiales bacterium]